VPFAVPPRGPRPPFETRHGIAFVGGHDHAPNPDALHYLIGETMPLVWREDPAITCAIVGHGWTPERLSRRDPRIHLLGPVDDLDTVFDTIRLTVAPLRFGAGIKGKVLDSFAAGLPCVMTPTAAEGLPLTPPLQALVADTPAGLAELILHYHRDQAASQICGAEARLVTAQLSGDRVIGALQIAVTGSPQAGAPALIPFAKEPESA